VRAIIQPKSRNDDTADKNGELLTLKPAAKITPASRLKPTLLARAMRAAVAVASPADALEPAPN
jgi:hypothetical protein